MLPKERLLTRREFWEQVGGGVAGILAGVFLIRKLSSNQEVQPRPEKVKRSGADPKAIRAVEFAAAQLGDGYLLGAEGPDKWDCARLAYFAYKNAGVLFRGSIAGGKVVADQWRETSGRILGLSEKKLPGDLIFFTYPSGNFAHVGIMIDEEYFIEASGKDGKVRITSVNPGSPLHREEIFNGTNCVLKGYKRIVELVN